MGQWDGPDAELLYLSLLEHLGVGSNNYSLSATRPVRNWRTPTYATDEKFQSFTTGLLLTVFWFWVNELLRWDPKDFCGISEISVPKAYLWRPDFTIMESIEMKERNVESTQVNLLSAGYTVSGDSYKLTSTCKMDLYKFPFDTQRCELTVMSFLYKINQLRLFLSSNSSDVTTGSLTVFQGQGEWDLISVHVSKDNLTYGQDVWDRLAYTITIARRPQLYIINFLVPVLVFLVLDLVSFFMNESRGEKLSFKVTILLAISVLLLILHDILPSTHQKTPVIGMFCTGVFLFVGCSIIETITVSFLMRMASKCDANALTWRTLQRRDGREDSKPAYGTGVVPSMERKEDDSSLLRLILAELQALRTHTSSDHPKHHGKTCLHLKTVAKWINTVYFILYLCAASVFLALIGKEWSH
ncbi:5-hydroxytryptamine receptor 3C-like [Alosa alosa]|uniref:5-hydroxytryptamine receptor 3C-like n=1 Tax=Alosa alosa TaxID=278164 RepID=UPI0020152AEA|nr:5-hydroxytryptamine receptor 3C-like [Alosa alosa]